MEQENDGIKTEWTDRGKKQLHRGQDKRNSCMVEG